MTTTLNSLVSWLMQPVAPSRWIRASAWAAVAVLIFQFLFLPTIVAKDAAGWHFRVETAIQLGFMVACAALAFLRLPIALLALGILGVWRLFLLAASVFTSLAVTDICAVLWVIGAVTTLRREFGGSR